MKRVASILAVAVVAGATIVSAQTGGSAQAQGAAAVQGNFSLQAMAHQSTAQFPVLGNVKPWDGTALGRFSYRSIPCTGNAPVNNISSNLPSYGTRTRTGTEMRGTTSIVVCQLKSGPTPNPDPVSDEAKPRIRMTWRAKFVRSNAESVSFQGTFKLVGGTQRYADLTGSGTIAGYLFCFAPEGCAGSFLDAQISMQGGYRDPTPQL